MDKKSGDQTKKGKTPYRSRGRGRPERTTTASMPSQEPTNPVSTVSLAETERTLDSIDPDPTHPPENVQSGRVDMAEVNLAPNTTPKVTENENTPFPGGTDPGRADPHTPGSEFRESDVMALSSVTPEPPHPILPLLLNMPEFNSNEPIVQDTNFLTTPTTVESELDHTHSFSNPESGSIAASGRNRRLSGFRGDERTRKISIGIGGVPKKGYWGGMDDSDDSDDSLLAQTSSSKRRKSRTFVLGPKLMGYNRRQWLILIVIAMVDFCSAVLISIQAPIYPSEAKRRDVSPSTYGILFGVFEFTIFIMSPTFFNLLRKVDMKKMFNFGILTTGISAILFSFLDRIPETSLFLVCSFVLRITEGIGDAAILTAAYAIVTLEFPDSVANTFTSLEAFLGIGFIVGPPLAGFLFQANGFMLPFLLFGIFLITSWILSLSILPKKLKDDSPSGEVRKPAFLSLLQIPSVALAGFSILTATISLGFLNSTLYAHLTQFSLTAPAIGGIFILVQGMYILSAPVWNVIINQVSDPKYISVLATILIFVAFLFVGPVKFLEIESNLEVTCAALALGGIALGGILVSGFMVIMKDTIEYGFPDNEATFGMSSGLYASLFTFGSFIGLTSSGILYDYVGFRWGCVFPLSIHGLLAIVTTLYLICEPKKQPGDRSRHSSEFQESEPLLIASRELAKSQPILKSAHAQKTGSSHGTSTSYESLA